MPSTSAPNRFAHRGAAMLAVCLLGLASLAIPTVCNAQTLPFPREARTFGQFVFRPDEVTYRVSEGTATIDVKVEISSNRPGALLFSSMRPTLRNGLRTYAPRGAPVVGSGFNFNASDQGILFRSHTGTILPNAEVSWRFEIPVDVARQGLGLTFEYRNPALLGQEQGSFSAAVPAAPAPPPLPTAALQFAFPTAERYRVPRGAIPIVPDALLTYPDSAGAVVSLAGWNTRLESVTYARSGVVRVNLALQNQVASKVISPSQISASIFTGTPNNASPSQRSVATIPNNTAVPDDVRIPELGYFYLSLEFNVGSEAAQREVSRAEIALPGGTVTVALPRYNPPAAGGGAPPRPSSDSPKPPQPQTQPPESTSGSDPTPPSPTGGFTNAGYFALRVDAMKRNGRSVEVNLTARNYQGGRQAVQQTDNRFFLATSRGEIRWNGNFYGATSAEHLDHTVWLEKDEQSQITYVFEGLASDATPQRLIVRDYSGTEVGSFDLSGVGETRTTTGPGAGGAASGEPSAGAPIKLDRYEVTLERVTRGPDRDWESVLTVRNASDQPQRLTVTEIGLVLYGADDRAWHASGTFLAPDSGDRFSIVSAPMLQPGEQVRVRLWHPQSASSTPTRFRVQEAGGQSVNGRL